MEQKGAGAGAGKGAKTIDVSTLGLKCGLEIHQQLDTGKLFCRCPTLLKEGAPDFEVVRSLRASAGETGEVDAAAKHEQAKAKRFRYRGYRENCCLVELDEEPPHPMNPAALQATVQAARLLKSQLLDEVTVMRKTVVDGSNTSGFQRTSLVALGGTLPEEPVRIQTICLEEDACRIVVRERDEDVYNLSRLGIPLIEIATEPDITTPEQAQRAAAEIGMVLRSTGKCKRGLGTIRQDLNVSIEGGARVEIKGAQDLRLVADLVRNEALRQKGLLEIKKELEERFERKKESGQNGENDEKETDWKKERTSSIIISPPHDVSKLFRETACGFVKKGIASGQSFVAVKLPGFDGLLGTELFPSYRLGTELAGYAKAFGFGGLIHTDEDLLGKYKFAETEIAEARTALKAKNGDALLFFLGDRERIDDLLAFLLLPRIERLLHGIPGEVRKANDDATTTFLRPMPGAARMYPETDLRRVPVPADVPVPKLLKEQEADLIRRYKIPASHAKELLREGWPLDEYVEAYPNLAPLFLATTILDTPKEIRKRYNRELALEEHERELRGILEAADKGTVPKEAVIELLVDVADGKRPQYAKFQAADDREIENVVKAVLEAHPDAPLNGLMGEAMAKLRGKASGKTVLELLQRLSGRAR